MPIACNDGGLPVISKNRKVPPVWKQNSGAYSLRQRDLTMTVDPNCGGRIVSLTHGGREILHTSGEMSGSTFWPGPQSRWNWPPPPVIDNQPYSVEEAETVLSIVSATDPITELRVRKTFSFNDADCIYITYEMINGSSQAAFFSPWEITRVGVGGTTFFPAGEIIRTKSTLNPTLEDAVTWYHHDGSDIKKKLFRDGTENWLAHLTQNRVFIKSWEHDIKPVDFAPDEAEIELYSAPHYLEVEMQGKYSVIEPGSSASWKVSWHVKDIPQSTDCSIGSSELIDFVRGCLS